MIVLAGCFEKEKAVPKSSQSSSEMIQGMVNNSLITGDDLSKLTDKDSTALLKMLLEYNDANDKEEFEKSIEKMTVDNDLKKRLLILLNNM
jgi:hypothetical protein